ncbi:MAG TPA: hypothetical protein VM687_12540 [Stenotrophomonas sp.]|nr:hypothetical protein [Stenotrophomonas sp.]
MLTILNSPFFNPFLATLAGALFGALCGNLLAERSNRQRRRWDALGRTNALIVLSESTLSRAISLKQDYVKPLLKGYLRQRREAETMNSALPEVHAPGGEVPFRADLVSIPPLTVPIEGLKSLTHPAAMMPGRVLALAAMIEGALDMLSHTREIRAAEMAKFHSRELTLEFFLHTYFGLRQRDGSIDELYYQCMEGIARHTDDVVFFAAELTEELQVHAKRLHANQRLAKDKEIPYSVDLSSFRKSGLIPPRQNYESYFAKFRTPA